MKYDDTMTFNNNETLQTSSYNEHAFLNFSLYLLPNLSMYYLVQPNRALKCHKSLQTSSETQHAFQDFSLYLLPKHSIYYLAQPNKQSSRQR